MEDHHRVRLEKRLCHERVARRGFAVVVAVDEGERPAPALGGEFEDAIWAHVRPQIGAV